MTFESWSQTENLKTKKERMRHNCLAMRSFPNLLETGFKGK
jgi:hypothetical protein